MLCPVDCLSRHNPIFDGGGITDTIIVESILTANHRRQTGGALFDFKEGSLFIGVQTVSQEENPSLPNQSGSTPNIAEYSHPLWIEAFRYIGPTGSSFNEDITATNISASGFISASEFVGDGSGLTNVTATAEWDGSLDGDASITGSLIVSGNADSGNISASGYVSASSFSGDGSGLTSTPLFISGAYN